MAELFGVKSQAITKHLGNIYEEEELTREATCSKKEQVQIEGGREVKRNFDFLISMSYYRKRPIIIWQEIKLLVVHMNTLSVTSGIRIDATEWDNIWQIMLWISLRVCQSL